MRIALKKELNFDYVSLILCQVFCDVASMDRGSINLRLFIQEMKQTKNCFALHPLAGEQEFRSYLTVLYKYFPFGMEMKIKSCKSHIHLHCKKGGVDNTWFCISKDGGCPRFKRKKLFHKKKEKMN